MGLPKKCNFGRIYGRLTTNGEYQICCGNVPSSGDYHTDGKFVDYWKSDKLNNLLTRLRDNLDEMNRTWADGNCNHCPHTVVNGKLNSGEIDIPNSPIIFNIDVINLCDHRCNFCWHWSYDMIDDNAQFEGWNDWVKEKLDFQIFKDIIDGLVELGDCEEIQIGGGGEPLLHPNIHEMIGYVKENNLSCKLITNFCQITEEQLDNLIKLGLDSILINISAGTRETYCETRRVKSKVWDKLLHNLNYISNRKKEVDSVNPEVITKFILTRTNVHEISEMIDLAIKTKADTITFKRFLVNDVYSGKNLTVTDEQYNKFRPILEDKMEQYEFEKIIDYNGMYNFNYVSKKYNVTLRSDITGFFSNS